MLTGPVLMIVSDVCVVFNLDEVLVSVSRVLLFAVNEELLVEGDVAPEADTVLVVRFEE